MAITIKQAQNTSFKVYDDIVFTSENGTESILAQVVRGAYDEMPYTPKYYSWSYEIELYKNARQWIVKIIEKERKSTIVRSERVSQTEHQERFFISTDEGNSWLQSESMLLSAVERVLQLYS